MVVSISPLLSLSHRVPQSLRLVVSTLTRGLKQFCSKAVKGRKCGKHVARWLGGGAEDVVKINQGSRHGPAHGEFSP